MLSNETQQTLLNVFKEVWVAPDNSTIYDWANQHITLRPPFAFTGKFDVSLSRYLIQPFDDLKNSSVKQINCMAAVKTGKTLLPQIWLPWVVCNAPGSVLWLMNEGTVADRVSETKTIPILLDCPLVKDHLPKDRFKIRKNEIVFPHMAVTVDSAKESTINSLDVRYLVLDECWQFKNGFLSAAKDRVKAHSHHSKILCISQAGVQEDEWEKEFDRGVVYEWAWICPQCKKEQVHNWSLEREDGTYSGINWEENDTTRPDGVWNFLEASKTARLECHFCKHGVTDTPENRKYLNDTGVYICTKPNGDPSIHSYRWPAWAMFNISFASLAVKYLQAQEAKDLGDTIPLEMFYQKELGRTYGQNHNAEFLESATEAYDPNAKWGDYLFMGVDVQELDPKFRYVIRAFAKNGDSRRIDFGTAVTWEELDGIRIKYNIPHQYVYVDSGDGKATEAIYEQCVLHGHEGLQKGTTKKQWFSFFATKGDGDRRRDTYTHTDKTERYYSPVSFKQVPLIREPKLKGTPCPLILWKNYPVKNILHALRSGTTPIKFVADKFDDEYERQMNSEYLLKEIDKKAKKVTWRWKQKDREANHYWDCECLCLLAALMRGIIGGKNGIETTKETDKKPEPVTASTS